MRTISSLLAFAKVSLYSYRLNTLSIGLIDSRFSTP